MTRYVASCAADLSAEPGHFVAAPALERSALDCIDRTAGGAGPTLPLVQDILDQGL